MKAKPFMAVSSVENLGREDGQLQVTLYRVRTFHAAYEKPESYSRFSVSLQFFRQSAAMVFGPLLTTYSESLISIAVLLGSVHTSAEP
jgi:hypothetical protein